MIKFECPSCHSKSIEWYKKILVYRSRNIIEKTCPKCGAEFKFPKSILILSTILFIFILLSWIPLSIYFKIDQDYAMLWIMCLVIIPNLVSYNSKIIPR